ncbi:antibiotic biosynthesis monooxygenase [Bacillus sp. NSP9.1]|nr:antibiotic biosynthesis monooxygenase [Bacillus sp. NSP9.1]
MISKTPEPPYYAVIFTSVRTDGDNGYEKTAAHMVKLAEAQPGFLGAESVKDKNGNGITVSYWESLEAIDGWKYHTEHLHAKERGRKEWYADFAVRVAKVESARFSEAEGVDREESR